VLTPADRAGLAQLARTPDVPRATRAARLAKLRPQRAARNAVAKEVRRLGLTVISRTTWSVTARGSAARVLTLFGSARASHPTSNYASGLPRMPASLRKYVTAAVGGDETRPAKKPLGLHMATPSATVTPPYNGAQLRAFYQQTSAGSTLNGTIATLQFDGWDKNDLTTYANHYGIRSYSYAEVSVDGRNPRQIDDFNGAIEVALDQDTLLGVAPHSPQRAYFAPNTDAGSVDALHRVAADATDAVHGSPNLVALSTSWGVCEPDDRVIRAEEDALEEIVASGVTVFAATGDSGPYDCGGRVIRGPAVDFPASSPVVIGVGGTTRWPSSETYWSFGGGGTSAVFPRPLFQEQVAPNAQFRKVPDIAAVADPATGYLVYSQGSFQTVGGTSLAAPAMTAMFANAIEGNTRGNGYILQKLYTAPAGSFRDITSGGNPPYSATAGYDTATGLGSPIWNVLGPALLGHFRTYTGPWGTPPPSGHAPQTW
jgi:kumamolisin